MMDGNATPNRAVPYPPSEADAYASIYPYSDGGTTATYHDWDTGAADTTTAQFIAGPINPEHYWSYPAATKWSLDNSGGIARA